MRMAKVFVVLGLSLVICASSWAVDLDKDMSKNDYLFGRSIRLPLVKSENVLPASEKQAYFTAFENIEDVEMVGDKLTFTLTAAEGTLGWGNYKGKQAIEDVQETFQESGEVAVKIKQSSEKSDWSIYFYRDGAQKPVSPKTLNRTATGNEWQEIIFDDQKSSRAGIYLPNQMFDGMSLVIKGEPGTKFELEWVKFIQPKFAGYTRHEFEIPEGKVWRAIANVGSMNYRNWYGKEEMYSQLYMNGQKIEREGSMGLYHTAPTDIAPLIKPGTNCVGFFGSRISFAPFLIFQARIIMESGEVITVSSDLDWQYSAEAGEGWSQPGFDASTWKTDALAQGYAALNPLRDYAYSVGIPAYTGRLVMKNPTRKDLYYNNADDTVVEVHVPAGLQSRNPSLSFLLGKSDENGITPMVKEGEVTKFEERDGSLVYSLNLGRNSDGVYALALSLKDAAGEVIEERTREPLVILSKIDLKTIAGTDYFDGLDVELEDTIDFTNPDDPHPSTETMLPEGETGFRIVTKGEMKYREVINPARSAGYSYEFSFKHPGDFYVLEVEYPDNEQRIIEVVIRSQGQGRNTCQSGIGAETGGRYLPTNKIQILRSIHVADGGLHTVDIINTMNGERSAAKSFKIYHIKGNLPSIGSGDNRMYGIHSERCSTGSGIAKNFGVVVGSAGNDEVGGNAGDRSNQAKSLVQIKLQDLSWFKETGERYVQYLKFAGQNTHVMGCYQYCERNTPFVPASEIEDSVVLHCPKTLMANIFDINNINVLAGLEFSQSENVKTYNNNAQVAKGADTAYFINEEGKQFYPYNRVAEMQNWLYPAGNAKYQMLIRQLARTFGHIPHFRGVHSMTGIDTNNGGYWIPGLGRGSRYDKPLYYSYDDITFDLFEADTGVDTGVEKTDYKRFKKRAEFLRNNADARQKFLDWRCDKLKESYADAVKILRKDRKDIDLINVMGLHDFRLFKYLADSGKPFKDLAKEFAYDIEKLNTVEGLWTGRWTVSFRHWYPIPPHRNPYFWMARVDPDVISAFERETNRFVFIRTSWDENRHAGGDIRALPQPGGYHAREGYLQAMITGDPELILGGWTDLNINTGHEQMIRSIFKTYTHLPKERFTPSLNTGLETNLAIRELNKPGVSYVYIANPGQWNITGSVTLDSGGEVFELVSGKQVAGSGTVEIPVELEPFGLVAYRVASSNLTVTKYQTNPLEADDHARLDGVIKQAEKLAGNTGIKPKVEAVRAAFDQGEYARAWGLLTHYSIWYPFQEAVIKGR